MYCLFRLTIALLKVMTAGDLCEVATPVTDRGHAWSLMAWQPYALAFAGDPMLLRLSLFLFGNKSSP